MDGHQGQRSKWHQQAYRGTGTPHKNIQRLGIHEDANTPSLDQFLSGINTERKRLEGPNRSHDVTQEMNKKTSAAFHQGGYRDNPPRFGPSPPSSLHSGQMHGELNFKDISVQQKTLPGIARERSPHEVPHQPNHWRAQLSGDHQTNVNIRRPSDPQIRKNMSPDLPGANTSEEFERHSFSGAGDGTQSVSQHFQDKPNTSASNSFRKVPQQFAPSLSNQIMPPRSKSDTFHHPQSTIQDRGFQSSQLPPGRNSNHQRVDVRGSFRPHHSGPHTTGPPWSVSRGAPHSSRPNAPGSSTSEAHLNRPHLFGVHSYQSEPTGVYQLESHPLSSQSGPPGPHPFGPQPHGPHPSGRHSPGLQPPRSCPPGPHFSRPHPSRPHPSEPHPSRSHPSGPHPSGPHPSGPHPSGPHPSGPHPSGPHHSQPHHSQPHPSGPHPSGLHPSGPHFSGPHPSGPHISGPHPPGPHPPVPHPPGPHPSGPHPSQPSDLFPTMPPYDPQMPHQHHHTPPPSPFFDGPIHRAPSSVQQHEYPGYPGQHPQQQQEISQREKDEEWLKGWLRKNKIGQSEGQTAKKHKCISIQEGQQLVKDLLQTIHQLSEQKELLNRHIHKDESTWQYECRRANRTKERVKTLQETLFSEEVAIQLEKKMMKTKKKRARLKRQRLEQYQKQQDDEVRRKEIHQRIDAELAKRLQAKQEEKREAELQEEVDKTLYEVRRKKQEVSQMLDLVKGLRKLRQLRKDAAQVKGVQIPRAADVVFDEKLKPIEEVMRERSVLYREEERVMQVMLEEEHEEYKEQEKARQRKRLEEKTKREIRAKMKLLFGKEDLVGPDNPMFPFQQFYNQASNNLHSLVEIRHQWDPFLVPDSDPAGSAVPVSWVIPSDPSSAAWDAMLEPILDT